MPLPKAALPLHSWLLAEAAEASGAPGKGLEGDERRPVIGGTCLPLQGLGSIQTPPPHFWLLPGWGGGGVRPLPPALPFLALRLAQPGPGRSMPCTQAKLSPACPLTLQGGSPSPRPPLPCTQPPPPEHRASGGGGLLLQGRGVLCTSPLLCVVHMDPEWNPRLSLGHKCPPPYPSRRFPKGLLAAQPPPPLPPSLPRALSQDPSVILVWKRGD